MDRSGKSFLKSAGFIAFSIFLAWFLVGKEFDYLPWNRFRITAYLPYVCAFITFPLVIVTMMTLGVLQDELENSPRKKKRE
jgi:hypothetical protein